MERAVPGKIGVKYYGHNILSRAKMARFASLWKIQVDYLEEDTQLAVLEEWRQGNLSLLLPEEVVKALNSSYEEMP